SKKPMSKRPGSSTESNAPKRQRKPAGFRAARPPSALPGASSSSNSALFVTVTQPDERQSPLVEDVPVAKSKRKRFTRNVDQLNEWLKFRATFLDEVLRHDGLGDFMGQEDCSHCGKARGVIRCQDCSSGKLLKCPECAVTLHQYLPLHRVERWNGLFFDKDSLHNLGLRYQLGHSGERCPFPLPGPQNFIVFDTSS
ncbi:hypothetical protein K443DRAFT_35778, partial [Laccaria amethystina LaAM-08-1]